MMTKEDYESWKHNPLTEEFHQFLRDRRDSIMEQWAKGSFCLMDPMAAALTNQDASTRCQVLNELVELESDFISQFYSKGGSDVSGN